MPKLGHFLGGNTVGIGLAEKRSSAVVAAAALATGYTMMPEHQWASGFGKKYMVYRPE